MRSNRGNECETSNYFFLSYALEIKENGLFGMDYYSIWCNIV